MSATVLGGLDGANPLAYLAALGTLRVVTEAGAAPARLLWRDEGRWRPVLELPDDAPPAIELVMRDLVSWKAAAELSLVYEKGKAAVRDLKPKPARFRRFLEQAASTVPARRWSDFAASYGSDFVRDGNGNVKPTAFHFTAGQQSFLDMVAQLAEGVTEEHLREALFGPWQYTSTLPVLRWDTGGERLYALLASNPAADKANGVPGADWLAFQALPLFPCFPRATLGGSVRLVTTCFKGSGKEYVFRWPVWHASASLDAARSLLAFASDALDAAERRSRGIAAVFESRVRRSDHGYGTFGAATAVPVGTT